MQSQVLDVLALNETCLDNTISDSEIAIDSYFVVRCDRSRNGGGVDLYIRNTINAKVRSDLSDNDLEFLCVEINKPKTKPFLISSWYRPPSSTVELFDKFEVLLGRIESENSD